MKSSRKELIKESQELQQKIDRLNNENSALQRDNLEKTRFELALRERVKELSCLYGIADLIDHVGDSIDDIMQGTVELIPSSWQYPEITCAEITLNLKVYNSPNFKIGRWNQSCNIVINGTKIGTVKVFYKEEKEEMGEGPFLKEERLLINAIAERLGRAVERIKIGKQLEKEKKSLEKMNFALREVVSTVQEEKNKIAKTIGANLGKIVIPMIHDLKNQNQIEPSVSLEVLERSLKEIASPFIDRISNEMVKLTPVEVQISNLIKSGFMSKDISRIRQISPATVSRHRERIRKKLGISNSNINLATYLKKISSE